MAAIGTIYANRFLNTICAGTAFTAPSGVYVALTTAASTAAGIGTEAAYTGYARVSAASSFSTAASSGSISNAVAIAFGACTAGSSTVVGFALMDASSAGNLIAFGTCSLSISSGITPQFAIGSLTLTET